MLRSPIKRGFYLSGLALASLLSTPAGAQNPTVAPVGSNVPAPDVRARMWAATARFVYGDDPALASLRPQLRQTIDSGSVNLFGRHLEDAVKLENKSLPKQEHVMKFQGAFKTISAKNEAPNQLASSIATRLLENKPERQTQASFVQLRRTLNALADPNAPAPTAAPAPASTADTTTEPAASTATPAASPAPAGDFTTSTTSSPMLTWVPWVALALSIVSLLVSLLKGNSSKHWHRSHSASASTLTSLTEEMKTEVHLIVQREVGKKLAGARPAPDAPAAKQPAPAQSSAPISLAKNAPAAPAKAAQPKPAQPKAPEAVPAPPAGLVPAAASPAPAGPAATPAEDDELFNINYITQEAPAAAPPAAPVTRTLYANQQPIDGLFQRNTLAEAPASYTIFELITSADAPDQARFVVTGNPAGHAGYIGSHVNILGGACEYPFPKGSVSRIVTDEPGVAQRTASGDWQISRKARIHFE